MTETASPQYSKYKKFLNADEKYYEDSFGDEPVLFRSFTIKERRDENDQIPMKYFSTPSILRGGSPRKLDLEMRKRKRCVLGKLLLHLFIFLTLLFLADVKRKRLHFSFMCTKSFHLMLCTCPVV